MVMSIVDGPEAHSNFEITRDAIRRNIRETFDRLCIKVYVFNGRVEIRGYIPTEVMEIPREAERPKGVPIIRSAGG